MIYFRDPKLCWWFLSLPSHNNIVKVKHDLRCMPDALISMYPSKTVALLTQEITSLVILNVVFSPITQINSLGIKNMKHVASTSLFFLCYSYHRVGVKGSVITDFNWLIEMCDRQLRKRFHGH